MTLRDFVGRLGRRTAAKRLRITEGTLSRWLRHGPSNRRAPDVAQAIARHARSVKAASTRKRQRKFQEETQTPVRSELPPEKVKPKKPPSKAAEALKVKRALKVRRGTRRHETNRYIGTREWFTVGEPVAELDVQQIIDNVISVWQNSNTDFSYTNFLFFRYIPFNPIYKGELVRLQGTWVDWWTRTPTLSTMRSISDAIESVFLGYYKRGKHILGAKEAAESRIIWLEAYEVVNLSHKEDIPGWQTIR